ncbi:hypothetical protein L7F22_012983 [Adiantum nelumboides]|nr:hypothetical protein [Adiantum nelumboides]
MVMGSAMKTLACAMAMLAVLAPVSHHGQMQRVRDVGAMLVIAVMSSRASQMATPTLNSRHACMVVALPSCIALASIPTSMEPVSKRTSCTSTRTSPATSAIATPSTATCIRPGSTQRINLPRWWLIIHEKHGIFTRQKREIFYGPCRSVCNF